MKGYGVTTLHVLKKNKEEMQKGLLDILTGAYSPSIAIRGDIFEKLVKEKMDIDEKIKSVLGSK